MESFKVPIITAFIMILLFWVTACLPEDESSLEWGQSYERSGNVADAEREYARAASFGNPEGYMRLGDLVMSNCEHTRIPPRVSDPVHGYDAWLSENAANLKRAREFYEKGERLAAEKGISAKKRSQMFLVLEERVATVQAKVNSAAIRHGFDALLKKAQEGDADSQYTLGVQFSNGFHRERVVGENVCEHAVYWLSEAAGQGHKKAIEQLATVTGGYNDATNMAALTNVYAALGIKGFEKKGHRILRDACFDPCKAKREEDARIARAKQEEEIRRVSQFNGVVFGRSISEYGTPAKNVDIETKVLPNLCCQSVAYIPKKAFRVFKEGEIDATLKGGVIFRVAYKYKFSSDSQVTTDELEMKQTVAALTRKYGEPEMRTRGFFEDGNKTYTYRIRDLKIVLEYIVPGRLQESIGYVVTGACDTKGEMKLSATNTELEKIAEQESDAYKDEIRRKEAENVGVGGEDAL